MSKSLKNGQNIEMRGFGTISRKTNKEKFVEIDGRIKLVNQKIL